MVIDPMGTEVEQGGAERRLLVERHVLGLIESGALRRGSRVPSILELARSLSVAKNTVIAALDELCGRGVLEARERQGFFVKTTRRRAQVRETRLADLEIDRVAHGMASVLVKSGDGFLPLGSGTAAESVLATPEWSATLRAAPPRDPFTALRYADPMGEPHLREAIAARHGGPDDSPDHVIITHGAIEALHLAFAAVSAETGSRRIALESPGYFMLAPIIESLGLEPVPLPRLHGGIDLDRLRHLLKKGALAAVMVVPNHHNPVGSTLSMAQRFELATLASAHRFWIVEDDVYRGLWTEQEEPPSIQSLLPQRTLHVSSFSKTLGPALRIGFVLAPDALLVAIRRRKFLQTLSGDAYTQNLVADFVDRRGYQRHLAEVREELARRARIALVQSQPFAHLGRFVASFSGGIFWRFEFAEGIDPMALYQAAKRENLLISPGAFFRIEAAPETPREDAWMRVNVSRCEGDVLARALRVLSAAAHGAAPRASKTAPGARPRRGPKTPTREG
jgi:DNA-binding transcriptional MocR family regulator